MSDGKKKMNPLANHKAEALDGGFVLLELDYYDGPQAMMTRRATKLRLALDRDQCAELAEQLTGLAAGKA